MKCTPEYQRAKRAMLTSDLRDKQGGSVTRGSDALGGAVTLNAQHLVQNSKPPAAKTDQREEINQE